MNLFENEQIITTTEGCGVILTTHRIRSTNSYQWGQRTTISIMLEKVSTIQLDYISYPIFLVMAGLCFVLALILNGQDNTKQLMPLALTVGAVFVIAYFTSRKHICVIASDGGSKIRFHTEKIKKDSLLEFLDKVEKAKNSRYFRTPNNVTAF
jgi:hypothetical protein